MIARCLVDVIDINNNVGIAGYNGVQWCFVLNDQFTGLLYVGVRYSFVFNTHNEAVFTPEMLMVCESLLRPDPCMIRGQPRNPREQGSIERSHGVSIKTILLHIRLTK